VQHIAELAVEVSDPQPYALKMLCTLCKRGSRPDEVTQNGAADTGRKAAKYSPHTESVTLLCMLIPLEANTAPGRPRAKDNEIQPLPGNVPSCRPMPVSRFMMVRL
jgi:hypothetical protein